jgi:pimeloyl-ACP methyl ester carboxylesterase
MLLRTLGQDGPYVLVGTSGGGLVMAGFAYAHPNEVKGMVFVERLTRSSRRKPHRSCWLS